MRCLPIEWCAHENSVRINSPAPWLNSNSMQSPRRVKSWGLFIAHLQGASFKACAGYKINGDMLDLLSCNDIIQNLNPPQSEWYRFQLDETCRFNLELAGWFQQFPFYGVHDPSRGSCGRDGVAVSYNWWRVAWIRAASKPWSGREGWMSQGIQFQTHWPNVINREGSLGNEKLKFKNELTPTHMVTLPFTRFMLGAGD